MCVGTRFAATKRQRTLHSVEGEIAQPDSPVATPPVSTNDVTGAAALRPTPPEEAVAGASTGVAVSAGAGVAVSAIAGAGAGAVLGISAAVPYDAGTEAGAQPWTERHAEVHHLLPDMPAFVLDASFVPLVLEVSMPALPAFRRYRSAPGGSEPVEVPSPHYNVRAVLVGRDYSTRAFLNTVGCDFARANVQAHFVGAQSEDALLSAVKYTDSVQRVGLHYLAADAADDGLVIDDDKTVAVRRCGVRACVLPTLLCTDVVVVFMQMSMIEPFQYFSYVLFMDGNNTASVAESFGFSASALVTVSWDGTPDAAFRVEFRRELFDQLAAFEKDADINKDGQPVKMVMKKLGELVEKARDDAASRLPEVSAADGAERVQVLVDDDASRETYLPVIDLSHPLAGPAGDEFLAAAAKLPSVQKQLQGMLKAHQARHTVPAASSGDVAAAAAVGVAVAAAVGGPGGGC